MASAAVFTYVVIVGIGLGSGVYGYGNGAAHPACTHMHVAHGEYQRGPSPYSITLPNAPTKYSAGCKVKLCIHQTTVWRGTLIQARKRDNSDIVPVGTWSEALPDNTRLMTCTEEGDSVTHANGRPKNYDACFLWNPPAKPVGDVFFIATVATTKDTWWMNLTTSHLSAEEQYESVSTVQCASGSSSAAVDNNNNNNNNNNDNNNNRRSQRTNSQGSAGKQSGIPESTSGSSAIISRAVVFLLAAFAAVYLIK